MIYSYLTILEKIESQGTSPVQTSKHSTVRHEIAIFSEFLNTISEILTSNELRRILNTIYKNLIMVYHLLFHT